jgi:outer membrane receptor protein involved in Fe transport
MSFAMFSIKYPVTFFLLILTTLIQAQNGFIRGTILDASNGETLPGSTIAVDGTTFGTITDLDGNFNLSIPPGVYTIKVSFISYETLTVNNVEVKAQEVSVLENIRLNESKIELGEVTVTAKEIRNTDAALNTIKMKSANLLDGISASSLKKIGDSDVASSMRRVSGVSVQGGKYVFVRGLGDRYSKTLLNGVDVPGLDPDKNTIQMDIFPTNIIDNLIVHKSFSAELPADFTGGVIDIEVKDFPEKKIGNISVSAGYSPNYHFNSDYLNYEGSSTDWLGFDNGTRDVPAKDNIPDYANVFLTPNSDEGTRYKGILNSFNPTMAAIKEKSFMDYGLGISYGNQHPLSRVTLGYNFAFSYKNNTEFYEDAEYGIFDRQTGAPTEYELEQRIYRKGDVGINNVFFSGLAGFALKTKNSKFRIYLMRLQNGESKAAIGTYESTNVGTTFSAFQHGLDYSQRSLSNLLIDGKHSFANNSWIVEWKLSPTISKIADPDVRFTRYRFMEGGGLAIGTESGYPERNWRYLDEINLAGVLHFTKSFNFNQQKANLKFGGAYTLKDRSYTIYSFQIIPDKNLELIGDPDELFKEMNLWPINGNGRAGTYFKNASDKSKNYDANVDYKAAYVSVELNFFKKLKSIFGLRYENYIQKYTGQNQTGSHVLDNDEVLNDANFFPSVNLVYNLTEKQNLRFSYSQTIARPSMKELSYAEIYDPISDVTFLGSLSPIGEIWDGNLVSTNMQNFDFRWELFQKGGQMISVSTFYKTFDNPIEMIQSAVSQKPTIQPRNVGEGLVFGAELEFHQNLGIISGAFNNLSVVGNFTYANSRVKLSDIEYSLRSSSLRDGERLSKYRDMAGMSPYIINAGLSYSGQNGFWRSFEAGLYYNVQGPTLYIVGIGDRADVYSNPFHSLNFNSSKRFGENDKFNIGLKIENVLNSDKEYVYKSYKAEDRYYEKLHKGVKFELKFGYSF